MLMRDLDRQPAQLLQREIDLVVRLDALRLVQFHRGAGETTIGPPRYRYHHFKISRQLRHRGQRRALLTLPLRLQKQLRLIQKPLANSRCRFAPSRIQLTRFPTAQAMPRKSLRHATTLFPSQPCHRHQELHRHMRCNCSAAHLLLHTRRKQFDQPHAPRYPTRAAIKTPRQLLLVIAEALR
jgi:hypothetical protein